MGEHKGYRIRTDASGKTRAEVWNPETQRYRSRSFKDPKEARAWAKSQAAGVLVGRPEPEMATAAQGTKDLAQAYTDNLAARGRSPSHLRNVKRTLAAVTKVVPQLTVKGSGLAIERLLDGAKVSPTSRNRMLVEIRAFCRWCMRRDLLPADPTKAIERATVGRYLRPQFTVAELVRLLSLPTPDPAWHRRFALLVYAGLRADEADALTWADTDLAGKVLLVRHHAGHRLKRGRERIVPLQPELSAILGEPGPLSTQTAPIPDSNDRRGQAKFLELHGVPVAGRSPHSCRHTYAGLMTATGVPGGLLGAYLGHSSAATTQIYTQLSALFVASVDGWKRGEFILVQR